MFFGWPWLSPLLFLSVSPRDKDRLDISISFTAGLKLFGETLFAQEEVVDL